MNNGDDEKRYFTLVGVNVQGLYIKVCPDTLLVWSMGFSLEMRY